MTDKIIQLRQPPTVREVNEKNEERLLSSLTEIIKASIDRGMTEAQVLGCLDIAKEDVLPLELILIDGGDDSA